MLVLAARFLILFGHTITTSLMQKKAFYFRLSFPCVCMTRYLMYCVNAAFNHGQGDIASNTRRFEIFSEYVYNTRLLFGTHKDTHE